MPENPECKHCADILNADLSNLMILDVELNPDTTKRLSKCSTNLELVKQSIIKQIFSKGKKIIFVLQLANGQILYMLSSLGMTGKWLYRPKTHTCLSFKIALANNTYLILYYDDVRRFGSLNIYSSVEELTFFLEEKVGPDFLLGEVNLSNYVSEIKKSKKQIAVFMLNQEKFSGIGNYLRAEILYLAKVSPFRSCNTLTDNEITAIYYWSIDRVNMAYQARGLTFSDYEDPYGRDGTYNPLVYNKKVSPEGFMVKKDKTSDGRSIYWVMESQS